MLLIIEDSTEAELLTRTEVVVEISVVEFRTYTMELADVVTDPVVRLCAVVLLGAGDVGYIPELRDEELDADAGSTEVSPGPDDVLLPAGPFPEAFVLFEDTGAADVLVRVLVTVTVFVVDLAVAVVILCETPRHEHADE